MDTATSHEDELRAALAQLEKHHAGDHRGFNESRRSICEQSAQRLARAEAAERERDEAQRSAQSLLRIIDGNEMRKRIVQLRADRDALGRYADALARGLSDAEARAEGWPAAPSPQAEPATCLAPGCSDGHQS